MKIILMGTHFKPERYGGWHLISAIDEVASEPAGATSPDAGVTPPALTRLPPWMADDHHYVRTSKGLEEFRGIVAGFIESNRGPNATRKVVFNLNGRSQPLPFDYVKVIVDEFRTRAMHDPIEVVVFANLAG
jgi:hypothetical protein